MVAGLAAGLVDLDDMALQASEEENDSSSSSLRLGLQMAELGLCCQSLTGWLLVLLQAQ